jgi:hypothetical protein
MARPVFSRLSTAVPAASRATVAALGLLLAVLLVVAVPQTAAAASRNPDDYLTLDLSRALMSPEPLGPTEGFDPTAKTVNPGTVSSPDAAATATPPSDAAKTEAAPSPATSAGAAPAARIANAHVRHAPTTRAARHHVAQHPHRDPLDARAAMAKPKARIQRWPCNSGGICAWQSQGDNTALPPPAR